MKKRITTTIEENLITELKVIAVRNNINMNDILEILIKKLIDNEIVIDFDSDTK